MEELHRRMLQEQQSGDDPENGEHARRPGFGVRHIHSSWMLLQPQPALPMLVFAASQRANQQPLTIDTGEEFSAPRVRRRANLPDKRASESYYRPADPT